MLSKISSIGLVLLVFIVVVISGCTSPDSVNVTESNGVKHFEGKGISFNAPNTWALGQMENQTRDYLFSIGKGTGENTDLIHFFAGYYNRTLSEHINSEKEKIANSNSTIISEKNLTVEGVPAYQITGLNEGKKITVISTCFMKNGILFEIYAVPGPNNNITSIEPGLEMVLNTFHAL